MYGYNAGQPMAIPIYTVLPYCVIRVCIYMYVYKDNVFFLFSYFSVPGSA